MSVSQNNEVTTEIIRSGDAVELIANVSDANIEDTHSYYWTISDPRIILNDSAQQTINTSQLSAGVYRVNVSVTDSASAMRSKTAYFSVVDQGAVLESTIDSDNDGIDDKTEGASDTDGDGIPNYLDAISASNVLQQVAVNSKSYLVECPPRLSCRLGYFSLQSSGGGSRLTIDDLYRIESISRDTKFDNIGGIFDFEISDLPLPGQTVQIVIPQISAIPNNAIYRKYSYGQWSQFIEDGTSQLSSSQGTEGVCPPPGHHSWEDGLIAGYYCVQLTIEDGGPNDDDGFVNGEIVDPGMVGVRTSGGGGAFSFWILLLFSACYLSIISRQGATNNE